MNISHLSARELIDYLEIYAETEVEKAVIKVMQELQEENSELVGELALIHSKHDCLVDDLECKIFQLEEGNEELKEKIKELEE